MLERGILYLILRAILGTNPYSLSHGVNAQLLSLIPDCLSVFAYRLLHSVNREMSQTTAIHDTGSSSMNILLFYLKQNLL